MESTSPKHVRTGIPVVYGFAILVIGLALGGAGMWYVAGTKSSSDANFVAVTPTRGAQPTGIIINPSLAVPPKPTGTLTEVGSGIVAEEHTIYIGKVNGVYAAFSTDKAKQTYYENGVPKTGPEYGMIRMSEIATPPPPHTFSQLTGAMKVVYPGLPRRREKKNILSVCFSKNPSSKQRSSIMSDTSTRRA